jgi:hypothetical protein
VARSTQVTPGGVRVCGREPLTADELAAVDELARLAVEQRERQRAAMTPERRAADDARVAAGRARLERLRRG